MESEPMMPVSFRLFVLRNGERRNTWINRPPKIAEKAKTLWGKGCWFAIEILQTGEVSMTCEREDDDGEVEVLAHEICPNGPEVPKSVDLLVERAFSISTAQPKEAGNDEP